MPWATRHGALGLVRRLGAAVPLSSTARGATALSYTALSSTVLSSTVLSYTALPSTALQAQREASELQLQAAQ